MTSQALTAVVRSAAAARFPDLDLDGLDRFDHVDKVSLLEAVAEAAGWQAVVALGRELRALEQQPVIRALLQTREPEAIVERWLRLERFGHSRNRTELLACERTGELVRLTLRHVAVDGGAIVAVNDLFVWGLFVALMESAGFENIEAALPTADAAAPFVVHGPSPAPPDAPLPTDTHTLALQLRAPAQPLPVEVASDESTPDAAHARLTALLRRDLLVSWTVQGAARALGMSARSLQRALQGEGTRFSKVVHQTRVDAARTLLTSTPLELSEIAFCVGFADQAHFARTFRSLCDVPPSAYREVAAATTGPKARGGPR